MLINKVEICGVNTSKLPVLSNEQKKVLFEAEKIDWIINKNRESIKLLASKIDQVIGGVNGELSVNCNTNW